MLNINAKKLNLIVLNIAIIFAIIFSNFYVYAISDETFTVLNQLYIIKCHFLI